LTERKLLDEAQSYFLNFDGLCEPKNPGGIATYGIVVKKGEKTIHEESGLADAEPWTNEASNNVAEYSGILRGLRWLSEHGHTKSPVIVRGDSRLVLNQMNGVFKVKAPRIIELYKESKELASQFSDIRFEWVDRSQNSEADLLTRIAYRRYIRDSKKKPKQFAL